RRLSMRVRLDDRADRVDGMVEPTRDLAARAFQRPRARGLAIEVSREPRAIRPKGLQLSRERLLPTVGLATAPQRHLERIERQSQTFGGTLDRGCVSHHHLVATSKPLSALDICTAKRFFYVNATSTFDTNGRHRQASTRPAAGQQDFPAYRAVPCSSG